MRRARVRTHWVVLGAVLLALGVALTVQGYTHHLAGISDDSAGTGGSSEHVPSSITDGGPVIDASDDTVRTVTPPDRTLALTFDDGPDPRWTPRILDVLREHGVHATFFVVGTAAIDHPELMRRILDEGHEVGLHTLSHADLGSVPDWRRRLEIRGSQQVITGITGRSASLTRPPYSSENAEVTDGLWIAIRAGADEGLLNVLTTMDSEDWRRPGVDAIERNLTPPDDSGHVLLMHDGGGDRSQTVEALDVTTSWEVWDRLRITQGLAVDEARAAMARLLGALLEAPAPRT